MAWVKGPNGFVAHVPDSILSGLIGDGSRGYEIAPEPAANKDEDQKTTPRKRTPRKSED